MGELVTHFSVCGAVAAKIEVLMCGWEHSILRIAARSVMVVVFVFIVGIVNRLKRLMVVRFARKVEIVLGGVIFLFASVACMDVVSGLTRKWDNRKARSRLKCPDKCLIPRGRDQPATGLGFDFVVQFVEGKVPQSIVAIKSR
jgi:hypothetical protein